MDTPVILEQFGADQPDRTTMILPLVTTNISESDRNQAYSSVNAAMTQAYWNIGKSIFEQQGKSDRAEYGTQLLKELSVRLTHDFGKGFTPANLRNLRQFYLPFPNRHALRGNLSWTHYRMLLRVETI